jgi:hypothetical protein
MDYEKQREVENAEEKKRLEDEEKKRKDWE